MTTEQVVVDKPKPIKKFTDTGDLPEQDRPKPGDKVDVTILHPGPEYNCKFILVWINHVPHIAFVPARDMPVITTSQVHYFLTRQEWIKDAYYGDVTHWSPISE